MMLIKCYANENNLAGSINRYPMPVSGMTSSLSGKLLEQPS